MNTKHGKPETQTEALKVDQPAWQPIEAAPRDQRLLLWNGIGMYCGHWAKSIETDDEAWIIAEYGNEGDQLLIKATHWMLLPDPPVSL
jgi:hypothetical protein